MNISVKMSSFDMGYFMHSPSIYTGEFTDTVWLPMVSSLKAVKREDDLTIVESRDLLFTDFAPYALFECAVGGVGLVVYNDRTALDAAFSPGNAAYLSLQTPDIILREKESLEFDVIFYEVTIERLLEQLCEMHAAMPNEEDYQAYSALYVMAGSEPRLTMIPLYDEEDKE